CEFKPHADGELRCLPNGAKPGHAFFTDAACSMPVAAVIAPQCGDPQPYLYTTDGDRTCTGAIGPSLQFSPYAGWQIYATGPQSQSATLYYLDGTGACLATPPSPNATLPLVGAELPADSFVRATQTTQPLGPRAEVVVIEADDGASFLSNAR